MDAPHWNSVQREPMPDPDRKQWAGPEEEMRRFPVNYNDHGHHSQHGHYSRHQREPQRHREWMEGEQPRSNFLGHGLGCREQSADLRSDVTMDPGGPSVGISERDNELQRKKKQLEEIQNRIIRKKAAIALKKITPFLKQSDKPPHIPLETCLNPDEVSLKDRVKCILQLNKSLGLPKRQCRDPTSSIKDGGGQQDDHPLKLRVKLLMNHRLRANREACYAYRDDPKPEALPLQQYRAPNAPPPNMPPSAAVPVQSPAVPAGFQNLQDLNVPPPTIILNPTLAVPVQSLGVPANFQHLQIHNRTIFTSNVGLSHAADGQLNPYPLMVPEEAAPGFQHFQSHNGTGLIPGFEMWPTTEGQTAQVHYFPPMARGSSQNPSPDSPSPAPLQRSAVAKGLQRFLNVLNKGVDINLFTSIVNDDSQSIPSNEEPLLNKPLLNEPSKLEKICIEPPQNDSHPSQANQPCHHSFNSIERPNLEGSHKERNTHDELRGNGPFPSGSASSCPPPKEENPAQLQLQKILKTLGLSFEEEEISGLTNRTEERLYGKKQANGQGLHETSGSEKPCEPSPKIRHSTSLSIPADPSPTTSPPQRPQEKYSMECRKRRSSPCIQSRERHSHDSQPRERRRDQDKKRHRDAETDELQDKYPHIHSETHKQLNGDPSGDSGTDKKGDRDHHRNSETYKSRDSNCCEDSEMDERWDRDRHRNSETYKSRDRGCGEDSELDKWWDRPRSDGSTQHFQNTTNPGGATNVSYYVNSPGATAPYPHFSGGPVAQNPSFHFPHTPMSSNYLHETLSSPSTSTHEDLQPCGSNLNYFNPDLSQSEGQHWSAQRCLMDVKLLNPIGLNKKALKRAIYQRKAMHVAARMAMRAATCMARVHGTGREAVAQAKAKAAKAKAVEAKAAEAKAALGREAFAKAAIAKAAEMLVASTKVKKKWLMVQNELTEEEVKAKLKKKLQEFNLKMKQRPNIPVQESSCSTYSDLS